MKHDKPFYQLVLIVVSAFLIFLGISVIFGWFLNISWLTQVFSNLQPMQFNTAIGMILAGVGLFGIRFERPKIGIISGSMVGLLGFLTLCEYVLRINLGIDTLLFNPQNSLPVAYPGRMAPNTALGFFLISIYFLINLAGSRRKYVPYVRSAIAAFIIGISASALFGYLAQLEFAYGWGSFTAMAVHTATAFFLLGLALISYELKRHAQVAIVVAAVIGFTLSLNIFFTISNFQKNSIKQDFSSDIAQIQNMLERNFELATDSVQSIKAFFESSQQVSRDEFNTFTSLLLEKEELRALAWLPVIKNEERQSFEAGMRAEGFIEFEFKEANVNGELIRAPDRDVHYPIVYMETAKRSEAVFGFDYGLDYGGDERKLNALNRARDTGNIAALSVQRLTSEDINKPDILFFSPVYKKGALVDTAELRRENLDGFAVSVISVAQLTDKALHKIDAKGIDLYYYSQESHEVDDLLERLIYFYQTGSGHTEKFKQFHWYGRSLNINEAINIKIADMDLRIDCVAQPLYFKKQNLLLRWQTAGGILLLTILICFYLREIINRNTAVEATVRIRTKELSTLLETLRREGKEKEAAREALQASEEKLKRITDAVPGAVYLYQLTADGKQSFPFMSKGIEPLMGINQQEAMDDFNSVWSLVLPEDTNALAQSIHKVAETVSPWTHEFRIRFNEDEIRWIRGASVPEPKRPDGSIVWTGILLDITHQKRLEETIKNHADELQGIATENERRAVELERANIELQNAQRANLNIMEDLENRRIALEEEQKKADEANKAKSEFLANMSHEIRTPLNAIIGFSDLLRGTPLNQQQADYANTIEESSNLLLALINDILDISKIEARQVKLESIDFNLQELIESLLKIMWKRARASQVELYYRFDDDVPRNFNGDPTRIRQILLNLLGNAVKFTEKGEVKILIKSEKQPRDSKLNKGETLVRISVKDTGIGIPQDKLNVIFQHFTQVDLSTTRKYGGTGLGLSISKALVEMMGGSMWVESELGQGSEFIFTLKLKEATAAVQKSIAPVSIKELRGKKALIIDDNKYSREILDRYCQDVEIKVLEKLPSAIEGLKWLDQQSKLPDFILSDVMIPEMDGYEFVRRIKQSAKLKGIKVVAVTSDAVPGSSQKAREAGFDAYLPKPIIFGELIRIIQTLFGDFRKESEKDQMVTRHVANEVLCKGVKVLVVEDNAVNRKLMQELLRNFGCECDFAVNGQEAVEKVRASQYDICLMDLQMPVMSGTDATQLIRRDISKTLPIVALTAAAMKEDQEKCLQAGMNDYLSKPVSPIKLKEIIYRWGLGNGKAV